MPAIVLGKARISNHILRLSLIVPTIPSLTGVPPERRFVRCGWSGHRCDGNGREERWCARRTLPPTTCF